MTKRAKAVDRTPLVSETDLTDAFRQYGDAVIAPHLAALDSRIARLETPWPVRLWRWLCLMAR